MLNIPLNVHEINLFFEEQTINAWISIKTVQNVDWPDTEVKVSKPVGIHHGDKNAYWIVKYILIILFVFID
jgi:hypothetical protein